GASAQSGVGKNVRHQEAGRERTVVSGSAGIPAGEFHGCRPPVRNNMRQTLHEFHISTRGRGFYEFTDEVAVWISKSGFKEVLLTLLVRHASASLLIQENADPDVRRDFEKFFARLVPDADPLFVHTAEGDE